MQGFVKNFSSCIQLNKDKIYLMFRLINFTLLFCVKAELWNAQKHLENSSVKQAN